MTGWPKVELSDLLQVLPSGKQLQQGKSPQCATEPAAANEWGVLKTTAIQPGQFAPQHNKRLPDHFDPDPKIEVEVRDMLLTCAGPRSRCGIPTLVRATRPHLLLSGKMYRFRADEEKILPEFLELFLLSHQAQEQIDGMKTGISDSGLNLTHGRFLRLTVPLPPLSEQRRVVEILEDHLSRIDAGSRALAMSKKRNAMLVRAHIDSYFRSSPAQLVRLGDLLAESLRNGHSAKRSLTGEGVRTLTLTAVTQADFVDANTKITSADPGRVRGLWLRAGDILVERSNAPELVGTSAIYEGPDDWAIFPDLVIRVRVARDRASPRFVAAALRSTQIRSFFRANAKGLSGSMPKIDQSAIAAVEFALPNLGEQDRFVSELTELQQASRRAAGSITIAAQRAAQLRRAALEAAFSGQL